MLGWHLQNGDVVIGRVGERSDESWILFRIGQDWRLDSTLVKKMATFLFQNKCIILR